MFYKLYPETCLGTDSLSLRIKFFVHRYSNYMKAWTFCLRNLNYPSWNDLGVVLQLMDNQLFGRCGHRILSHGPRILYKFRVVLRQIVQGRSGLFISLLERLLEYRFWRKSIRCRHKGIGQQLYFLFPEADFTCRSIRNHRQYKQYLFFLIFLHKWVISGQNVLINPFEQNIIFEAIRRFQYIFILLGKLQRSDDLLP